MNKRIISIDVGIKNLSYVILELENDTMIKILDWQILNIECKKNENQCEVLVHKLDENLEQFNTCHEVIIEKQPSKNNKMRIIEGLLNAYFIIKGKCIKESEIYHVLSYSAKHKLNDYIKNMNNFVGKTGYSARKKLSVEFTKLFLSNTSQEHNFVEMFNNSKKKDDLADCLMQGLKYLNIENFTKQEYTSIITKVDKDKNEKVSARKPTDLQMKRKLGFSKPNIKWFIEEFIKSDEYSSKESLYNYIEKYIKLKNCIIKHFESIENCLKCMNIELHTICKINV